MVRNKIKSSTQSYLDIAEIKDGAVIMRDGSLRSVLLVSSVNFALKSEDEQNAIISAYVGFLNSISFPVQIIIQSRELNIDGYLSELKQRAKEQTNELLKMQIIEYTGYINELISMAKIMNKRFYIAISYNALADKQKGFFSRIFDVFKPVTLISLKEEKFRQHKTRLDERVGSVISALGEMGMAAVALDTQSLIELFYNTYNPATAANQKLAGVEKLRLEQ